MSTKGLGPDDVAVYHQIERALAPPRDRILVVGGRESNWDDALRNDPDVEFWDTTDPVSHRKQAIPYRVGCIVFTPFVGHSDVARIEKFAPREVRVLKGETLTTGRLKRILHPLLEARRVAREREAGAAPAQEKAAAPPEGEPSAPRPREKITPARMMTSPAVLEPIVAAIVAAADKDGVVSGHAASQIIMKFTGVEVTAQHIKFLARGGYLNPTKSPEGKRYSRYRVMEKAVETARHYEERTVPPKASELLGQQLDNLSRRVAALETERETLFRELLSLAEEVVRVLTRALAKK